MINHNADILIGNTPLKRETKSPTGAYVDLAGETFYRIAHYDQMPPFLMSLVSSSDHWLFIASTGGLTAGRRTPDAALFPYETEDKIAAHSELTGAKTIIRVHRHGQTYLWEPFSNRYAGLYRCERRLYKNIYGDKLVFEEVNHDLQFTLRTGWFTGDRFGFIRRCWLHNDGDSACRVDLLDGVQNLLPAGASSAMQNTLSSLLNAYKRNELDPRNGLGIFTLSATLTDRAEPSESLRATVAWQVGLDDACHLLCTDQLDAFRTGRSLVPESDERGKAGAYLVSATLELPPAGSRHWCIVADVEQDSAAVVRLEQRLQQDQATLITQLETDIAQGSAELVRFVAAADGLQFTNDQTTTAHHFANVLFNILRGGIFANGYQMRRADLVAFARVRNRVVLAAQADWFNALPKQLTIQELHARASDTASPDLIRLCHEYLPLTFSRRHGDPSRPWNSFSINLREPDGSSRLDYQGNWRDIFQNWEALACSFPHYIEGLIAKFLNATTADGYNPYRLTRDGIEWETPDPDNPWSNIGYWSDHQIIYLQKLLELAERFQPGALSRWWNRPVFAYADVPYRLSPYQEMLADWQNTIAFDWEREKVTEQAVFEIGTDGRLLRGPDSAVIHVTMIEKLLVLLLAKLTNLVPEGGIWMNTQRPEWNDANNALTGKGLSVVSVAYLNRFIAFWQAQLESVAHETWAVNTTLATFFADVLAILTAHQSSLATGFTDQARRDIMDDLGLAATDYRAAIYQDGLPATQADLSRPALLDFLALAHAYIGQTLRANQRPDGLMHSYNILRLGERAASVEHLYLMLEGQVALLSSGMLTPEAALALLRSLPHSSLYRADQHTYLLYPNRELPGFRHKNNIVAAQVADVGLAAALAAAGDGRLLVRDEAGDYHFNGRFRNAADVAAVLDDLAREPAYSDLTAVDRKRILDLFEATFNHRAFTGRSGTFFAYEGLGSVYWHMVSKLLLAAQECYQRAAASGADAAVVEGLATAYYDIRAGLGFNKEPGEYGAFPTDPYSHTPMGSGARQPGMTGQVKEGILARLGELGVSIHQGALGFTPTLLRPEEFLRAPGEFAYVDVAGQRRRLILSAGALAFTLCQVPVVYVYGEAAMIEVTLADGQTVTQVGNTLDATTTRHVLARDGVVERLQVTALSPAQCKGGALQLAR